MPPRPTVLVAEGNRALRDLLRVHLQNAGYNVTSVSDAIVAGRTLLQSGQVVDALIVDAQLPYISGIDFVASMIADSSLRFIPTIVLCENDAQARRADLLGVPVLTTPVSATELL